MHYPHLVFLLLSFALLIRLPGLDKAIWLDEYSSLELIARTDFLTALRAYDHPPLYFVLLRGWASLSQAEWVLRGLSVLFSLGTVAVMLAWLKIYSKPASLVGSLLLATLPITLEYAHEIRNYALLLLTTALAFYFAEQWASSKRSLPTDIKLAISLSLVVLTHLVGVMVLPSVAVFILAVTVNQKAGLLKNPAFYGHLSLTLAVPMMLFLVLYYLFLPPELRQRTAASWWMPTASLPQLWQTAEYMLGLPVLLGDISLTHFLTTPTGGIIIGGALLCLLPLILGEWRQSWPLLLAAMTYWLVLLVISTVRAPIFIPRTALPGLIPLIGFVAVQLTTIRPAVWQLGPLIGLTCFSFFATTAWLNHKARQPVEDWPTIATTLAAHWQPHDLVIFYPGYNQGPTRYYYPCPDNQPPASPGECAAIIPPESVVTIWIGGTIDKLGQTREQVQLIENRGFSSAVFLVLRDDQNIAHERLIYDSLQTILETKFGRPTVLHQSGNLGILRYER